MEVGVEIFCRWGVERRVGVDIFFDTGLKKRWGRIWSSNIEERDKLHNKLSLWCRPKSFIRNLFKRSPHCLPQQCLGLVLLCTVKSDHLKWTYNFIPTKF